MDQELISLFELAQERQFSTKQLFDQIKKDVLIEFLTRYPQKDKAIEVLIDPVSGRIRLLHENTDITPAEFIPDLQSVARQTIISLLKTAPAATHEVKVVPSKPASGMTLIFAHVFFWVYNALFFIIGLFSLIGNMGNYVSFKELLSQQEFLSSTITLILSAFSMAYVFLYRKRFTAGKLVKFLFLIELPALLLGLLLSNLEIAFSLSMWFFILMAIMVPVGIFYFPLNFRYRWFSLGFFSWVSVTGLYLVLIFSFFMPVIFGAVAKLYFSSLLDMLNPLALIISTALFMVFAAFMIMPYLMITQLIMKLAHIFKEVSSEVAPAVFRRNLGIILGLFLLVVGFLHFKLPVDQSLKNLSNLKTYDSYEKRWEIAKSLIPQKQRLEDVLLDAQDSRSRYPFQEDNPIVADMYEDIFGIDSLTADVVQSVFNTVAYPFVYRSSRIPQAAFDNYYYLFGEEISSYPYAKPALPAPQVKIISRNIAAVTAADGLFATVTFTDEFENTTFINQEVIYEFSLPEDAVITGLKLGPNLEYEGLIAPRGAAQQTYEREITKSRDPALLEQTGPRQYRLRVFPIPNKNDTFTLNGQNQKVQFTYTVAYKDIGYPLPQVTQLHNAKVVVAPAATVDDQPVTASVNDVVLASPRPINLCDLLAKDRDISFSGKSYRLIPHLNNPQISAKPVCRDNRFYPGEVSGLKVAVFVDASASSTTKDIQSIKKQLSQEIDSVQKNQIDVYFYNDLISQPQRVNGQNLNSLFDILPFGLSKGMAAPVIPDKMDDYDAVIIASGTTEPLPQAGLIGRVDSFRQPIYLLYTNGIPAFSTGLTSYFIHNDNHIADDFSDALTQIAVAKQRKDGDIAQAIIPYPQFVVNLSSPSVSTVSGELLNPVRDPMTALAAKTRIIADLMKATTYEIDTVTFKDKLNQLAESAGIVTPVSSYISLVNRQQLDELKRNSLSSRRYNETAPATSGNIVSPMPPLTQREFDSVIGFPDMFGASRSLPNAAADQNISISKPPGFQIMDGSSLLKPLFIAVNLLVIGIVMVVATVTQFKKSLLPQKPALTVVAKKKTVGK